MTTIIDGSTGVTFPVTAGGTSAVQASSSKVLQIISVAKVDAFTTTSGTAVDVTGLTVNITPSSATSKILVLAQIFGGSDAATAIYINLVRNSTSLNVGTTGTSFNSAVGSYFASASLYTVYPIVFLDSPATTSAVTYKTQFANFDYNGGAVLVQSNGAMSTITLLEVAG